MPPIFNGGKLLFRDGKIALSENCCCDSTSVCCLGQKGSWLGGAPGWPPSLTATITNAGCGTMNQSLPLSAFTASGIPQYTGGSLIYCDGSVTGNDGLVVQCSDNTNPTTGSEAGRWQIAFLNFNAARSLKCSAISYFNMELLDCDPLHLIIVGMPVCDLFSGAAFTGTMDVEVME